MEDIKLIDSLIKMGDENNEVDALPMQWLQSIKEKIEDGKTLEEVLDELEKEVI